MTAPKFVAELPPNRRGEGRFAGNSEGSRLLAALRANPNQWAEVERYPLARRSAAGSKGSNYKKRHPDIDATTRRVGDEIVLYMRAVTR